MDATLEAPKLETSDLTLPEIPEFEGSRHKMEVLNRGEVDENGVHHDLAVPFQLKEGTQGLSFVVGLDNKDNERIINVETLDKVSEMSEEDFSHSAILQQVGDKLSILREGQEEIQIDKDKLQDGPQLIPLNDKLAVEVVKFDPEKNQIVLRKQHIRTEVPPAPTVPPEVKRHWKQKFIDLFVPLVLAGSAITGGHDAAVAERPPVEHQVEVPPSDKMPEFTITTEEGDVVGPKQEVDPSLQCETTVDFQFESGDYLTKALVDVNGWDRYVNSDGNINVDKLYEDLACMLALPQNREQIRTTDPAAANFIDGLFSADTKKLLGEPTAKAIFEGLSALNKQREGSHDQLVVNQPGDHFQVPKFGK